MLRRRHGAKRSQMTLPEAVTQQEKATPMENDSGSHGKAQLKTCNICDKKFSTKNSLIAHLNSHSFGDNDLDAENDSHNKCKICFKKFTVKKNLLKHLREVHKNFSEAESMVVKKLKCPESNCEFLCRMMKELRNHIEKSHRIKILKDVLQFPSEAVFQKWKKEEESNTVSWFVTGRKKATLRNGIKKQTFHCHRTGHYSPKGFGKYRMRSVGSCKIGVTCPATMEIMEHSDGAVTVIYHKTHLGHMQDMVYLKLTNEEKGHLAEKIKQGFSFDAILEDIKESKEGSNEKKKRIHLLSKKELYNIMYRIRNGNKSRGKSKQVMEQSVPSGGLEMPEQVPQNNMTVEENKRDEEKTQNLTFYTVIVPSQEQSENIPYNSNVFTQMKGYRDYNPNVNIPQTSTEEVPQQIVIFSPNSDSNSLAEIILLSTADGTTAQPAILPQNRVELLQPQGAYIGEPQIPMTNQVLANQTTKISKSDLSLQLREKLLKITECLPLCEHLTPKQYHLINLKLDSTLDIFSVAGEKAAMRKQGINRIKPNRVKPQ